MRRFGLALAASAMVAGVIVTPIPAAATNTLPTNPVGFAYNSTAGLSQYAHPGGMLVAGHCNRYAPEFAAARANGAEVLAYLNTMQRNDSTVCALDDDFYGGPPGSTPLWPFPSPGTRVNWPDTHMLDIRVGSSWVDDVVAYVENLMVEDKVDGVFLDDIGARPWGTDAQWSTWPLAEQQAWAAGSRDIVKRLDERRRAVNPRFIIVNNNVWDLPAALPEIDVRDAEQYVDGICIEHAPPDSAYHMRVAGKPYGNLGHRRVLAIGLSAAEAQEWATVQGVTHVSGQRGVDYGAVLPPPVDFHRLTDRPKVFGRTSVAATPSAPMVADKKRGSKFTLSDRATMLSFSAYLDGLGGPTTGSQTVRMAIYKDNNGVPNGRWAMSNIVTLPAQKTPGWVDFTSPATPLDPGAWWLVIHTGDTNGVLRDRVDGAANFYSNTGDAFADGPSNPFGTGTAGAGTLSVKATYTVGY
jgi:hypothetical protein